MVRMERDSIPFRVDDDGAIAVGTDGEDILNDLAAQILCDGHRVPQTPIDIEVHQGSVLRGRIALLLEQAAGDFAVFMGQYPDFTAGGRFTGDFAIEYGGIERNGAVEVERGNIKPYYPISHFDIFPYAESTRLSRGCQYSKSSSRNGIEGKACEMMRFCGNCGGELMLRIPEGDDKERSICASCQMVHYQNPKIVTGCLISHKKRILLCRRAIQPEQGLWTLPAGFMENGETTEEAAIRESWEEGRAKVLDSTLYMLFNLPQINQVYLMYRGELTGFHVGSPGFESENVGLFAEEDLPWKELAFPSVIRTTIAHYLQDRKTDTFPVRSVDIRDLVLWDESPGVGAD